MARKIGTTDIWRFEMVVTTITIVVTIIVSRPEFLFLRLRNIVFGKVDTPRNHEMLKPAPKPVYPYSWQVDLFKKVWKFPAVFCPGCVL